jgi:hypothetical protein
MNEVFRKKYEGMARPSETTNMVTGEQEKYIPHRVQSAWFREEYPAGRIVSTVLDCDRGNYARVKTEVYRSVEEIYPIAVCEAERWSGKDGKKNISPVAWAQTAAESRALQAAGFGILCQIEGDLPLPEPTDVSQIIKNTGTQADDGGEPAKKGRAKKTTVDAEASVAPAPEPSEEPVEAETEMEPTSEVAMSETTALEIIWPYGPPAMKDKKIGTLLREGAFGKRQIDWVLSGAQERPNDLVNACRVLQSKFRR